MREFGEAQLASYQRMLEERVFCTDTKWPHFRQLLREIRALDADLEATAHIVSLERGLLYGGISLLAPFFGRHQYESIDCSPPSAEARGAYNAELVNDERVLRVPVTRRAPIDETGVESASADLVMVPNLVHHVADQDRLWAECARIAARDGLLYVFEPLVRELHQEPDDFLRYTPYGMQQVVERHGFRVERVETEGGPFSVVAYCWVQALQYLPEDERETQSAWFYNEHLPQLMAWDTAHTENRVRKNTSFPMSFSILARKTSSGDRVGA